VKKTVTFLDGNKYIRLFRIPKKCTAPHQSLGKGLTILGEDDILIMPSVLGHSQAKRRFADDRAIGRVKIATASDLLLGPSALSPPRVIEVRDIKIADIVIGEDRRSLQPSKVDEIAESFATIGQTNPVTVTPRKEGKYDLVSGAHRVAAAQKLGWTFLRAQVMEGDETALRLAQLADDLHRAGLTVLEQAKELAEWVRLTEKHMPLQHKRNAKGGRPFGAIGKAARELPVKGGTEKARRKAIERAIKIDAISPEAQAVAKEAGIDDKQSALLAIARVPTSEQLAKAEELKTGKSKSAGKTAARGLGAAKGLARGLGKMKKRVSTEEAKPAAPTWMVSAGHPRSSLSAEQKEKLDRLLGLWDEACELKEEFAEACADVQECFAEEIRGLVDDDDDPSDVDPGNEHERDEDDADNWD
jgi:ParB family transcriptional regulator, chromosome partitioning protein